MTKPRRTQKQRSQATKGILVDTARQVFGAKGYEHTSVEDVVQLADVTRGALYHHFGGKRELFLAVTEQIEGELLRDLLASSDADNPSSVIEQGIEVFLDHCVDPVFQQVVIRDGPFVLGLERWHDTENRLGGQVLAAAVAHLLPDEAVREVGQIRELYSKLFTNMFIGALIEAAKLIAEAAEPTQARQAAAMFASGMIQALGKTALESLATPSSKE